MQTNNSRQTSEGSSLNTTANSSQTLPASIRPRVVIVGAGFGGLSAARQLGGREVQVLMLDRNNYHGFWPLLYQVATAGLEPQSISYPVRAILRHYQNIQFQMANVREINLQQRRIITDGEEITYDYLILAAGSANNYFGNNSLARQTFGLKNIQDAIRLRNHALTCFERAVRQNDLQQRKTLMTFVIVGGGPTGVELAGAFAELIRHVIRKDYPTLDMSQAKVVLVEATGNLLSSFHPTLQQKARLRLEQLGVQVRLNTAIDSVQENLACFKDGSDLETATVVWAAGVQGAALARQLDMTLAKGSRVPVMATLNLTGYPEAFVIGDLAYLEGYKEGRAYPLVAPVAIQQGRLAARNVMALIRGRRTHKFRYFDKGSMATIGRQAAVLEAFGIRLSGYLAWLSWLFVHLMTLVGFRNRLIVLTNWAINYFTYERGARLITGQPSPPDDDIPDKV